MRRLLALLSFVISLSSMTASDCRLFYVGTYTRNSKSQGIYLGRFNPQTGRLSPVELAAESIDPSCISFAPSDP